jgi:hypothetical protein
MPEQHESQSTEWHIQNLSLNIALRSVLSEDDSPDIPRQEYRLLEKWDLFLNMAYDERKGWLMSARALTAALHTTVEALIAIDSHILASQLATTRLNSCHYVAELLLSRHPEYGDSWRSFGIYDSVCSLGHKVGRLRRAIESGEGYPTPSPHYRDTAVDIMGYSLLALVLTCGNCYPFSRVSKFPYARCLVCHAEAVKPLPHLEGSLCYACGDFSSR